MDQRVAVLRCRRLTLHRWNITVPRRATGWCPNCGIMLLQVLLLRLVMLLQLLLLLLQLLLLLWPCLLLNRWLLLRLLLLLLLLRLLLRRRLRSRCSGRRGAHSRSHEARRRRSGPFHRPSVE